MDRADEVIDQFKTVPFFADCSIVLGALKIEEDENLRNRIDRLDDAIHLWKEDGFN